MNTTHRIFVEKRDGFRVEAQALLRELNLNLNLNLTSLRLINVYDLFSFPADLLEKARYSVFAEVVTDEVYGSLCLEGKSYLAIEPLPGQFDQRAASAVDCVKLIDPTAEPVIRSARLLLFDEVLASDIMQKIEAYSINKVECRKKDMTILNLPEQTPICPVQVLEGFRDIEPQNYAAYCQENGLAMNGDDLACVVEYFKNEGRDPYETELKILDTYWSDHCRHTTFTSHLTEITVDESFIKAELEESLDLYHKIREELGRQNKPLCLMDLATIGARYLRKNGYLNDLEVSEENNACSIYVNIDVDGQNQKWLLQFKNETHNHPTEIEPFGGASTCLGGAIRDPLSGRAYVYQAMRVTGAGNIYTPVNETIEGKLPQRIISTKAAAGYSSYGNQIGLATTHVREIYHPAYVAKRMEVGAVVGAVKADNVRRESPQAGDIVLMFGGRTGRDGVGGATGSSKSHNDHSLESCSSEVQKGNAPEERKIQRLFRRAEVTSLIKKSNDFGAGGVSVAIGELADGLDIYLDRVKVKYSGLNATELAISESQERMSVVIEAKDKEQFEAYCREENLEVIHIADVTDSARMRMFYRGRMIVDLSREFIDSAGAVHYAKANIGEVEKRNIFAREVEGDTLAQKFVNNLKDDNVLSQKGLIEMFDSTIGASTVLMPFGGKFQRTETQVSVQKLPVDGFTSQASMMAFGYNPYISSWSPYHGAAYAVVEACAKVVAAGGDYKTMRFSYQEYFEKMASAKAWGKPLAALLGALKMQYELKLPSIGGKDSMSGTFKDINVPPTLIAFGITMVNASDVVVSHFKKASQRIYLLKHTANENFTPNTDQLKVAFDYFHSLVNDKKVSSAFAITNGGVAEAIAKMSFGSSIGAKIVNEENLFDYSYGSILFTTDEELSNDNLVYIGATTANDFIELEGEKLAIEDLYKANTEKFETIYAASANNGEVVPSLKVEYNDSKAPQYHYDKKVDEVICYLPAFPGTNCDYDMAKAFRNAGATTKTTVFCNLTAQDIENSIDEMVANIDKCHILAISGGFSLGDEPDGSAKFIASVLTSPKVSAAIERLLERKCLIIGICNGFQALVKSGLLPYGKFGCLEQNSPTLFRNNINRHISQIVSTAICTNQSPWLSSFRVGDIHSIAVSHGEGKFVVEPKLAQQLFENKQVAFCYVDEKNEQTLLSPQNPNGSSYAIEGIISPDGLIIGKMGHTERYGKDLFLNIEGNKEQPLFYNAVKYFKG